VPWYTDKRHQDDRKTIDPVHRNHGAGGGTAYWVGGRDVPSNPRGRFHPYCLRGVGGRGAADSVAYRSGGGAAGAHGGDGSFRDDAGVVVMSPRKRTDYQYEALMTVVVAQHTGNVTVGYRAAVEDARLAAQERRL